MPAIFVSKESEKYCKKFGKDKWQIILDEDVKIGMTKEMCELSWGKPNEINQTILSGKKSEQWVYLGNGDNNARKEGKYYMEIDREIALREQEADVHHTCKYGIS